MADILEDLAPLIGRINKSMAGLIARDEPVVANIGGYSFEGGGKRLRPLIFCLVSEALGRPLTEALIETGASFEFLHMATLLHDDIIDEARLRRGREAAHLVFGVPETVLAGDYLLAKAALLGAATENFDCIRILSHLVESMSLGELNQLALRHKASLTEAEYFRVIYDKTATLMEGAAHSAAVLAGAGAEHLAAAKEYGHKLGLAFQIMDDVLDYQSDEDSFGKPVGHDLLEGKITLPFIRARQALDAAAREELCRLADGAFDAADWPRVLELVKKGGGVESALEAAGELANGARSALAPFASSPAREHLDALAEYVVTRKK